MVLFSQVMLSSLSSGSGKPSGKPESAHCVIDTKVISEADAAKALPKFNSDGSKVTSKGIGLNKAFVNKKAQFTVDTSSAGKVFVETWSYQQ